MGRETLRKPELNEDIRERNSQITKITINEWKILYFAEFDIGRVLMNQRNQQSHQREFVDFYHYNPPDSDSEDLEEFKDHIQVRPTQDFQIRNAEDRESYENQDR
ncbi:unnamed protein product [Caenorhabditis angaria]|uniref:Uncharacterized protein n=1 Tax=Caenorhabditis angaria TaxID=860376 RepID=A0A9P1J583_9PELO|nr:unnamed protein product [Caenorhabditis angaria]